MGTLVRALGSLASAEVGTLSPNIVLYSTVPACISGVALLGDFLFYAYLLPCNSGIARGAFTGLFVVPGVVLAVPAG
jgi:hypothetical protein